MKKYDTHRCLVEATENRGTAARHLGDGLSGLSGSIAYQVVALPLWSYTGFVTIRPSVEMATDWPCNVLKWRASSRIAIGVT